ncbi:MAG TPA: glucodextranase DOMON-like domain-containing protein [Elusimicrobiales bacterium]|nr:glucodextranase DOMON-like domain-containing protein [Elusimicrobiales bacterium]
MELALRVPGDPPLPLLFSPDSPEVAWPGKQQSGLWASRLDIMASVMFQAQTRHKTSFMDIPSGFVPAGGGTIPQMIEPLAAYEMRWLATGPSFKTPFEVLHSSGILLIPFHLASNADQLRDLLSTAEQSVKSPVAATQTTPDTTTVPASELTLSTTTAEPRPQADRKAMLFTVIDDSLSSQNQNARPLLAEIMKSSFGSAEPQWLTISTASALASSAPLSPADFPRPWTNNYNPWAGALKQRAALHTLSELRRAINISRSDGHVGPQIASAMTELERGDNLLLLASTETAAAASAEETFKQKVAALYKQAGLQVPVSLRGALTLTETAPSTEQLQASTDTISVKAGNSYIMINNPLKPLNIPSRYKILPNGTDPQQLFNAQAVLIDWDEKSVKFHIRNRRLARQERELLSQTLLVDVYMDINNRRNSGTIVFLPGRRLSANPDDSWEYAISVTGAKAQSYKTSLSGIQAGKTYNARLDYSGDVVVEIPRADFRGNPRLWGYTILIMGAQGENADKIFAPAPAETGENVIDWLGAEKSGSAITALRAPDRM